MNDIKFIGSSGELIEKRLEELLSPKDSQTQKMFETMKYSTLDGGKRVRAYLVLAFYRACGGKNIMQALDYACAMEMIHAASLIHDDLPSMDNDDYRRGRLSSHKKFGEAQAILAGDGLFIKAFSVVSGCAECSPAQNAAASLILAEKSGPDGMCGGQMIDIESTNLNLNFELLKKMDLLKTSCLISASCMLGCIAAGKDETVVALADEYGRAVGLAYQIRDDILDADSEDEVNEGGKANYVSMCGYDDAVLTCNTLTEKAITLLSSFENREAVAEICDFTYKLANRNI